MRLIESNRARISVTRFLSCEGLVFIEKLKGGDLRFPLGQEIVKLLIPVYCFE